MTVTGLLGWLVVRQGLTRRIYGAADAKLMLACLSRSLQRTSYRSRCPPNKAGWFHATTVVSYPGYVCRSSRDRRITSVIQLLWWWLVYEEV